MSVWNVTPPCNTTPETWTPGIFLAHPLKINAHPSIFEKNFNPWGNSVHPWVIDRHPWNTWRNKNNPLLGKRMIKDSNVFVCFMFSCSKNFIYFLHPSRSSRSSCLELKKASLVWPLACACKTCCKPSTSIPGRLQNLDDCRFSLGSLESVGWVTYRVIHN